MKLENNVKMDELPLEESPSKVGPRADMYLPLWLMVFSLVLMAAGLGFGIAAVVNASTDAGIAAPLCFFLGLAAFLCWKNQKIKIISNDTFVYRTFLGNEHTYRFDQIRGLIPRQDSCTLLMENGKIHMERCAILTKRLSDRINQELDRLSETEDTQK